MTDKGFDTFHGLNISNSNQNETIKRNCPFRVKLLIIIGIVICRGDFNISSSFSIIP